MAIIRRSFFNTPKPKEPAKPISQMSDFSTKRLMKENERLSLGIIRLEEKLRDLEFENFLLKNKKGD